MQSQRRWLPRWQRVELAQKCLEEGMTRRQAAAWRRLSVATVQYWVERRRAATPEERRTGSWAEDRRSTPKRQPRLTSAALHERVCEERRRTGWGPRLIASEVGLPHSTVSRCLERRGLSRPEKPAKGGGQTLRVALPGRPAADGHQALRAFHPPRPRRHWRPLPLRQGEAHGRRPRVRPLDD
jgi:transposase